MRPSAYWTHPEDPASPPITGSPTAGLLWVERVVAAVPCTAVHRVAIERLQPYPAALEGWEVGPVRATARIGSDRQTVEVVFYGSVSVAFRDPDGESHRIKRPFQLRRELLVPPVPPSWRTHVQAGGSAGRGGLERAPGAVGFRGDVHLVALVHLTEPVAMEGLGGRRRPDPAPVPVIAPGSEEAGVPPVAAGRSDPAADDDRFHQGLVLEGDALFGPGLRAAEDPAGASNGDPAGDSGGKQTGGTVASSREPAPRGAPRAVRLQGVVALPPGDRPLTVQTRPVPHPTGVGWALHVEVTCEDRQGRRRTASWLVNPPPGLDDPEGSLEVVGEQWLELKESLDGAAAVRPPSGITHTLWLRGKEAAPLSTPRGPATPAPAARAPFAPAPSSAPSPLREAGSLPEPGTFPAAALSPSAGDAELGAEAGDAGKGDADRSEHDEKSARDEHQGGAEHGSAGAAGEAVSRGSGGTGRTLVWRLPQPDAPPSSVLSSMRRPGSKEGSR